MAFTQIDEKTQGINTNLTLQSNAEFLAKQQIYKQQTIDKIADKINQAGDKLVTTFGAEYGKELSDKAISEQIDKGANGEYNHANAIMSLTPVGQVYNQAMDRARNIIIPAYVGNDIQRHAMEIKSNPTIAVEDKPQALAMSIKGILDSNKNLPTDTSNIIKIQSIDEQNKMIDFAMQQHQLQQLGVVQNGIKLHIDNAIGSKSIENANNSLQLGLKAIDGLKDSGVITPQDAETQKIQSIQTVFGNFASRPNVGIDAIKEFNKKTGMLGEQDMQEVEKKFISDFNQQQRTIETQQLLKGFDYNNLFAKSVVTGQAMPNVQYTAEQNITNKNLNTAHRLYNTASSLYTPEEHQRLLSSADYQGLDNFSKSIINSNLGKQARKVRVGLVSDEDLLNAGTFRQRRIAYPWLKPENLFTKNEKQGYLDQLNDPTKTQETIQSLRNEVGSDLGNVLKTLSQGTINDGLTLRDNKMTEDMAVIGYIGNKKLLPKFNLNANKSWKDTNADITKILEMGNNQSQMPYITDHMSNIASFTGTADKINNEFEKRYTLNSGRGLFWHEHDNDNDTKFTKKNYNALYDKISNLNQVFKTKGEFVDFMSNDNTIITPNSVNNTYKIYNTENGRSIQLPYGAIDELPSEAKPSLLQRIAKSLGGISSDAIGKNELAINTAKLYYNNLRKNNE